MELMLLLGWIALLVIAIIGFSIWFDVWVHVHYRIWKPYKEKR